MRRGRRKGLAKPWFIKVSSPCYIPPKNLNPGTASFHLKFPLPWSKNGGKLNNPGKQITIVLDNAAYQRARIVRECAEELGIKLLFLPSYSPNLNLIERYWKFLKKECLNNKYYEEFELFCDAITNFTQTAHRTHRSKLKSLMTLKFQTFKNNEILAA
jgi:transposase